MTYWKIPSFRALQQTWYERLRDEGFQDAEEFVDGEMVLKHSAVHPCQLKDKTTCETKEEYYRVLAQRAQESSFQNDVDHFILALYAEGKKIKLICEELQKRGTRRCRNTVTFTVRRYEMKWGLRVYSPKQLNRKTG